jgi:hypothetical protein
MTCGADGRRDGCDLHFRAAASNADSLLLKSLARLRGQTLRRNADTSNVSKNSLA